MRRHAPPPSTSDTRVATPPPDVASRDGSTSERAAAQPPRPTLTPGSRRSPATQDGLVTRAAAPRASALLVRDRRARPRRAAPSRFRGVYAVGHAAVSPRAPAPRRAARVGPTRRVEPPDRRGGRQLAARAAGRRARARVPHAPRSRPGLLVHETRRPFGDRSHAGLPFTPPLRTLEDLRPRRAEHSPACAARRSCASSSPRMSSTRPGSPIPTSAADPSVFARRFQLGSGAPACRAP